jgi:hypothetical protein
MGPSAKRQTAVRNTINADTCVPIPRSAAHLVPVSIITECAYALGDTRFRKLHVTVRTGTPRAGIGHCTAWPETGRTRGEHLISTFTTSSPRSSGDRASVS